MKSITFVSHISVGMALLPDPQRYICNYELEEKRGHPQHVVW